MYVYALCYENWESDGILSLYQTEEKAIQNLLEWKKDESDTKFFIIRMKVS